MRGPLFAAGEETEAEPVAVEEAAPVVEDKVSAATYVFGAPGEFRRDMALMGTTPVFMLPLAIWLYGARVTRAGVIGTLLTVAGVAVCFAGGG